MLDILTRNLGGLWLCAVGVSNITLYWFFDFQNFPVKFSEGKITFEVIECEQ